jgi:membrane-associated phospholipid phosphatase
MIEYLLELDYQIFEWINQSKLFWPIDNLLIFWRNSIFWFPLYLFIVVFLIINFGKKAYWILLFSMLTFGTSDMISSQLIKKTVKRLRPCRTELPLKVTQRAYCGSGYSFTSSHATNHFAIAIFWFLVIGKEWKYIKIPIILWALIVCFAQVYVGVHFPSDVFAGSILGITIGYFWTKIYVKYYGKQNAHSV